MADRALLAQHRLDAFKAWLTANGHAWRPGRGDYQVIQVQLAGSTAWHVIYRCLSAVEHYTVPEPLRRTVRAFVDRRPQREGPTLRPRREHAERPTAGGPPPWE